MKSELGAARDGGARAPVTSPDLVGRGHELAVLQDSWSRTCEGSAVSLLVSGDAGIGKSRLIADFTERLAKESKDTTVLVGRCVELGESGLPFAPFTAVLRQLAAERGVEGLLNLLPHNDVGELGRLLPLLGIPRDGQDSGLGKARLFEQVLALLQTLAEEHPLVLVIEDLHRADRSSIDLLGFLMNNQQSAPGLLMVISWRSDHLARSHPMRSTLAELGRLPWVGRIDLGPLARAEVLTQLNGLLGAPVSMALAERIHRRSNGNPLFVEALSREAALTSGSVPESIRDLLTAPLSRLAERSQEVVQVAALGGGRVSHALLLAVSGLDDSDLSKALRPAVEARVLVVEDDAFSFAHPLVREAVQDDLLPGEQAALHARYAEVLEQHVILASVAVPTIELAHHWLAGPETSTQRGRSWQPG